MGIGFHFRIPLCRGTPQISIWHFALVHIGYSTKRFCSLLTMTDLLTQVKASLILPPSHVKGMQKLDRAMFTKKVKLPYVKIESTAIEQIIKQLKPFMLKMDKFLPVRDAPDACPAKKLVILHPDLITSFDDFQPKVKEAFSAQGIEESHFGWDEVELCYDNWKMDEILRAILPDECMTTSYSRIGHIVHLNLREYLTDYRFLIGQVILDKLRGVSCVVNKTESIDTKFRNFTMEVLAGENNMLAKVKENGCQYEFDFSEVFWNPRLCGEHERVVEKLERDSILYDVFAGVGPFAIPAARKKKCQVLANDLNVHSFKWLEHNIKLNKVGNRVKAFNMDGREFIREVIKPDVISRWNRYKANFEDQANIWEPLHIVMNLPAIAIDFLDVFRGWLSNHKYLAKEEDFGSPTVHCYMFCKEENFSDACPRMVESVLGSELSKESTEVIFVRKVAPNKEMIRVSFKLTKDVMFNEMSVNEQVSISTNREKPVLDVPDAKRLCTTD